MQALDKAKLAVLGCALVGVGACGGGGSSSAPPPVAPAPPPPPPPPVTLDFSAVEAAVDASPVADMAIVVGDETGVLFAYEKGTFTTDQEVSIASASKMAFGLLIWDLVESGDLALGDNPQDYIGYWTDMAGDGRSEMTLDQLLG
ncbi:MAG: serine hydrolase, partial [Pseudomonadota bacterium]